MRAANQKYWLQLLEQEIDNLRAALEWALDCGDVSIAARILGRTYIYWIMYGRQAEGMHWAQLLLTRSHEVPLKQRILLLRSAALLIAYRDKVAANRLARDALAAAYADGDRHQIGWSLWALGTTLPDSSEADAVSQQAIGYLQETGDQVGLGLAYNSIGERARLSGDYVRARSAYERSLVLAEATGDLRRQYYVLYNLAFVAQHEGDHYTAIRTLRRSFALCQDLGGKTDVMQELLVLAGSLGALGSPLQAAHLFGAARTFLEHNSIVVDPNDQPEHDRNMLLVRQQLGDAAFAAAWVVGQQMTFDQAVAYALTVFNADEYAEPDLRQDTVTQFTLLTRREREVALQVATGKSNRAIADALFITERTVEGHVSNILAKLGLQSRAQVAVWIARNQHLSAS